MMRDPYSGQPLESDSEPQRPKPSPPPAAPTATIAGWGDPDALVARVAAVLAEPRRTSLARNLVAFGELLKLAEMDVTTGRLIDAARSLALVDVSAKSDVKLALQANLLSSIDDESTFNTLFELYWRIPRDEPPGPNQPRPITMDADLAKLGAIAGATQRQVQTEGSGASSHRREGLPQSFSEDDVAVLKDFADFGDDEVREVRRLIRRIAPKLATAVSRRQRPSRSGEQPDLRRSLRRAAAQGGEIVELARRRRKVRKLNLVLLCDVSGSMDTYSRFLVQFIYGLQNELHSVNTFVFSTRLFDVTPLLRRRTFDESLQFIGENVDGWSGGTNIGESLRAFNHDHGKRRLDSRTVVVIISDGWDRGETHVLEREMQSLKRRSYKVLWLNPLLGRPLYEPLCKGMATALPHTDYFLPAHNLASLMQVGRTLVHLARR